MNPPITYIPEFVPNPNMAFAALRDELAWERRDTTPRCEYYANDYPHDYPQPYTYGAGRGVRTYQPQPYHPVMSSIREQVEARTGALLEVSFLNKYLDQSDQLGEHADDSDEMDDDRPIGIISLGIEREIWFRANDAAKNAYFKQKLGHGSLCIMHPGMQNTHKHRVPKASFMCNVASPHGGVRISITLRGYISQKAVYDPHSLLPRDSHLSHPHDLQAGGRGPGR